MHPWSLRIDLYSQCQLVELLRPSHSDDRSALHPVEMHERRDVDARADCLVRCEIAAAAGVVPHEKESGQRRSRLGLVLAAITHSDGQASRFTSDAGEHLISRKARYLRRTHMSFDALDVRNRSRKELLEERMHLLVKSLQLLAVWVGGAPCPEKEHLLARRGHFGVEVARDKAVDRNVIWHRSVSHPFKALEIQEAVLGCHHVHAMFHHRLAEDVTHVGESEAGNDVSDIAHVALVKVLYASQ